jgi:hypothetical protein
MKGARRILRKVATQQLFNRRLLIRLAVQILNQIFKVQFQVGEDPVQFLNGEQALAFQNIVQVRLGYARNPGKAAFGKLTAMDAFAEMLDQIQLQALEGDVTGHWVYFSEK